VGSPSCSSYGLGSDQEIDSAGGSLQLIHVCSLGCRLGDNRSATRKKPSANAERVDHYGGRCVPWRVIEHRGVHRPDVLPHAPDAWVDNSKTVIGYETSSPAGRCRNLMTRETVMRLRSVAADGSAASRRGVCDSQPTLRLPDRLHPRRHPGPVDDRWSLVVRPVESHEQSEGAIGGWQPVGLLVLAG
jgi:hypothetical protein